MCIRDRGDYYLFVDSDDTIEPNALSELWHLSLIHISRRGFTDAQMYLSIFYGWDNSFKVPSYASAGADGYFMNNYTYPKNDNNIPDETASDADLINRARLSISVSKFLKDYPDKPLVVEFGFHTLEYNGCLLYTSRCV